MVKKIKLNAKPKEAPKIHTSLYVDEYVNFYTDKVEIILLSTIDRYLAELTMFIEIAYNHMLSLDDRLKLVSSFKMNNFYLQKGMSKGKWYSLLARFPRLKEKWEEAKERMGNFREIGLHKGVLDKSLILLNHHHYDSDHDQSEHRAAQLKKDSDPNTNITVQLLSPEQLKPNAND